MTNRELFRALGEVREGQILEAEGRTTKKGPRWRRYGAAAACLALLLGLTLGRTGDWAELTRHFSPALSTGADAGDCTATGDVDGSEYSSPGDAPAGPNYSVNVEFGEMFISVPGTDREREYSPSSPRVSWSGPEEILDMDTVIFRGTVRGLRCSAIESGSYKAYYTIASVEITDCIRGELAAGDIYNVLYTGIPGKGTNVSGDLKNLIVGSDAVFMPFQTTPEAGWITEDGFFAYIDLAELYFEVGPGLLFLDTGDGLSFDRDVYAEIAGAETLDEVVEYLREMIGARKQIQPAADPAELPGTPQPEPSHTVQAGEATKAPANAHEQPGGAYIGDE